MTQSTEKAKEIITSLGLRDRLGSLTPEARKQLMKDVEASIAQRGAEETRKRMKRGIDAPSEDRRPGAERPAGMDDRIAIALAAATISTVAGGSREETDPMLNPFHMDDPRPR